MRRTPPGEDWKKSVDKFHGADLQGNSKNLKTTGHHRATIKRREPGVLLAYGGHLIYAARDGYSFPLSAGEGRTTGNQDALQDAKRCSIRH